MKKSRDVKNENDKNHEKSVERETFKHVNQHDQFDFDISKLKTLKKSREIENENDEN